MCTVKFFHSLVFAAICIYACIPVSLYNHTSTDLTFFLENFCNFP